VSVRIAWERRGSGFPLVLVHGLGYARWGWEPVVDALAERYEVVLLDNRGIGESEALPGPYTAAGMAADVLGVLDAAQIERAHLLGTSLGGMIAQEIVLTAPDRVEKLVLACSTPGGPNAAPMPEQTVRLMAEAPGLEPMVALRRFVENALAPGASNGVVDRIIAHRLATAQPPAAWMAQAAAGAGFDAWDRLPELRVPTLVLHGTVDVVVDPANAEFLAARIPNARVERFPGCGHLFFWEEPERFVASVGEFLG
jgi:pimeloyl-ACP methyl ester carboxylesterase